MNREQALDVLKRCLPVTNGDFTQAITIAIAVMEAVDTPIMPFLNLCKQGKVAGITTESTVADVLSKLTRHQSDTETGI